MSDETPRIVRKRRKTTVEPGTESSDLAAQLNRARTVAQTIREATEKLNDGLRIAEAALAELGLGVSAAVTLHPATSEDDCFQLLKFGKDGNEWKFLLVTGEPADPPDYWHEAPLLSASRELRETAARMLPQLLDELIKTAEHKAKQVERSSNELNRFLQSLAEMQE